MKKFALLFTIVLIGSLVTLNSCKDDETFAVPSVTAPTVGTVITGTEVELQFSFSAEAGFKSATVQAINGTATVSENGTAGSETGTITVKYIGSSAGAGSVTIVITDDQDQTSQQTAVITVEDEETEIDVASNISADTTWETGKVYILKTRIAVLDGVTLTIQPGVVVKGEAGTGANATALIVARGGKIMAEGTSSSPIIFTSVADNIMPGQIASPNLDPVLNGLWGGVIILGKAHISAKVEGVDVVSTQIEGIPPTDTNGLYGGTNDADNSGVFKFISIRHGGANIGEGNEINGLTLGGVGSGTVIENIEIVSNQDDGIEFFGGKPTVKNVVCWNVGDDALDTDQAFSGMIDNAIVINPGDECFELDGPEGSYTGAGHTIKNVTCKVEGGQGLIDFDANTDVNMMNIYFYDLTAGQDVEEFDKYSASTSGFASSAFQVTLPSDVALTDVFKGGSDAITTVVAEGQNTVGATTSVFSGWTWAAVNGAF